MATYYLEAYDEIHIGRKASKFDLQCLDCYHETPIFNADPELGEREIIISAVKNSARVKKNSDLLIFIGLFV